MESIQGVNLTVINGKPTTTSRQIATHFNKRHNNVLRAIEKLDCSPQFADLNFQASEYEDNSGKACKEYIIYRDGFTYLAMGFTGKRAGRFKEAYIKAFNEMENKLLNSPESLLQQLNLTVNDLFKIGISLEKTVIEITHTTKGEIIDISRLEQKLAFKTSNEALAVSNTPSWQLIVETFFNEIESGGIPKKMRQNILLSKETTSTNEQHDCLFFRLSNLMAFFRKTPRFADLIHKSTIRTASMLLKQLKAAGVLAFEGKEKEKGIPMNSSVSSDRRMRRVSHLVALDLVVLERDYGMVMRSHREIARTFD